jgi:hypothetical protein
MKRISTSEASILAFAILGSLTMSLTAASAATTVREHRNAPVVRDHRDNAPIVRDHRADPARQATQGGVSVTSRPRGHKCVGDLCGKKVCIGPLCT